MLMTAARHETIVRGLLERADVRLGGDRDQDIVVHDARFYARALIGSLGLGESYMDGLWSAQKLDACIEHILRARLQEEVGLTLQHTIAVTSARLFNMQSRSRSTRVAREHYDLSGILPDPLLDPYNQYTCAYFDGTDDLNSAQEKKLHLICNKLDLQKEDRVLDIGCGWGGFAKFAATHYGCHVTGISISEEQITYAKRFCEGLPIDIRYCDYRDLAGTYDKVLTCGMMEHVGSKNYRSIFQIVHDHLAEGGLYLLHTIGSNASERTGDPFLEKYIFPGGVLPSIAQIEKARQDLFTLQDVQNLAAHYSLTLAGWYKNLQSEWSHLAETYSERFRRMFEYYLLSCKGAFDAGHIQHWQLVFSKCGTVMDYRGAR